ncbi:MAG TPA: M14 family zinc carboxypeptidase [Ignavibacteriaceae bacterium]|nr:M14 family zinc carboxypeptidase [Ignavibacteriaceae bacterium]
MKSFLIVLFIAASTLFSANLFAQQFDMKYFQDNPEIYFSFDVSDRTEINNLTNIISIDNVSGYRVLAYANENEFKTFLSLGYKFDILTHPGRLIIPEMSNDLESILNWNVYPTYDAYLNMMNQFAANYPAICKIVDAGNSVQGRKILFAKISSNVNVREAKPQFMYTSSMHGDELTGYVLMLRLIDSLLTSYGNDPRITNMINNIEIWINPLANPDGTYRSGNHTVSGATRSNFNNYDLNRNFPDPINGVHPNQQPETAVFRNVQESNNFLLIANFHGGAEVMNYPWDRWSNTGAGSRIHADQSWYQFISRMYADTAQLFSPPGYMTFMDNGITNGGAWYVISGGRQDYTNYYRWGREVTAEISNTKMPSASLLPNFWVYNKRSLLTYMESVLFGVNGIITDTVGTPLTTKISVIAHDVDNSQVWSDQQTGFYLRMLSPGTYTFKFEAEEHYDTTISNIYLASYFSVNQLNVQMKPLVPIPVELASFTASVKGNIVTLNWVTASEVNNRGFEVERKSPSPTPSLMEGASQTPLRGDWGAIGFVEGKGTTTELTHYSFDDNNLAAGTYQYRIKQIDFDGTFKYYNLAQSIEIGTPTIFILEQNYPNPFNPSTKISYTIPSVISTEGRNLNVTLKVFDVLGNEVKTLVNEYKSAGRYEVEFDAGSLSSGVYYYQLRTGEYIQTKKMILIR